MDCKTQNIFANVNPTRNMTLKLNTKRTLNTSDKLPWLKDIWLVFWDKVIILFPVLLSYRTKKSDAFSCHVHIDPGLDLYVYDVISILTSS